MSDDLPFRLRNLASSDAEAMSDADRVGAFCRVVREAATIIEALRSTIGTLTAENVKLRAVMNARDAEESDDKAERWDERRMRLFEQAAIRLFAGLYVRHPKWSDDDIVGRAVDGAYALMAALAHARKHDGPLSGRKP